MLSILNVASVVDVAGSVGVGVTASGVATTAAVIDISDIMRSFYQYKLSSISQFIKDKSRDLQKLLENFNRSTISVVNVLLPAGVLLIIFVLYSKDLLAVVVLLFNL